MALEIVFNLVIAHFNRGLCSETRSESFVKLEAMMNVSSRTETCVGHFLNLQFYVKLIIILKTKD